MEKALQQNIDVLLISRNGQLPNFCKFRRYTVSFAITNYLYWSLLMLISANLIIYCRFACAKTYASIFEIGKKRAKDNPNTAKSFNKLITVLDHPNIGGGGIRTHDTFTCIHAFQACSIGRSDTPPRS